MPTCADDGRAADPSQEQRSSQQALSVVPAAGAAVTSSDRPRRDPCDLAACGAGRPRDGVRLQRDGAVTGQRAALNTRAF